VGQGTAHTAQIRAPTAVPVVGRRATPLLLCRLHWPLRSSLQKSRRHTIARLHCSHRSERIRKDPCE
jgi:hypothetical protein